MSANDSRCICSPNLITVTHEKVLKPIHTVFVGRVIRVDVLHELPFDASQPSRRRFNGRAGQGISGHAEDAVGGVVRGSDRHVLAARIHYGGRDVEGGG